MKSPEVPELPRVQGFVALRRSVSELARAIAFYRDGLGFQPVGNEQGGANEVVLALGTERIVLALRDAATPEPPPVAGPDPGFQHMAIVTDDMDAAFARLERLAPVAISRGGPQRLPAASGGVLAFKFRDADGHPVELIEFPPGQGAPRWQQGRRRSGPTLGIDHVAISVADAGASVAFYQRLGFSLASWQTNRGEEQARLDGLDQSEVDVVALMPVRPDSPHLELLAYLTPPPVRSAPRMSEAADRVVWQARAASGTVQPPWLPDPDGHLNEFLA